MQARDEKTNALLEYLEEKIKAVKNNIVKSPEINDSKAA